MRRIISTPPTAACTADTEEIDVMTAFATRYHTATIEGLEVFYREAGDPASPTLLLLHGFPSSSHMFRTRVAHVLADDYTPHSAVDIFVKDLDLVLEAGKAQRFPLGTAAAAHQLLVAASGAGYGTLDDAAVVKVFEDLLGFEVLGNASLSQ